MFERHRLLLLDPTNETISILGCVGVPGRGGNDQHAVFHRNVIVIVIIVAMRRLGPYIEAFPLVLIELAAYHGGEVSDEVGIDETGLVR